MTLAHRQRIGRAFGAAQDYDRHARVQRRVAQALADRIAALPLPESPRVLEVGCGTGFLTQALVEREIGGDWLVSDIAPEMVERCRARVGETERRRFAVLDGEYDVRESAGYDLVCSSLAMQWFDDPAAALGRTLAALAPGGHCVFATLTSGSFAEWRAAHDRLGLVPGTPDFESVENLAAMHAQARVGDIVVERIVECHDDAAGFLRALKAIGAQTPKRRHRPLAPRDLRRVMATFDDAGACVTYEVATAYYLRAAAA